MGSRCQKPIMIRNKSVTRGSIQAPCGKCENCLKRRVSNWSFRLLQEDKVSDSSYFLTLTYGSEFCPVPVTKNGFMDLSKHHLQLFFKRLRKAHGSDGDIGKSLKYYAVGEYGGKRQRPHYHIILFNARLELLIGAKYADAVKSGILELDGKRQFECEYWSDAKLDAYRGGITIGKVSGASVGYTMKYVSKPSKVPMHRNDDRTPEFSLMSKGLGESYLTGAMVTWHKNAMAERQYCVLEDGKKVSMPRYYKNKILSLQEKECLRAINVLEAMKGNKKRVSTARDRSEAYYTGIERSKLNYSKNQKF